MNFSQPSLGAASQNSGAYPVVRLDVLILPGLATRFCTIVFVFVSFLSNAWCAQLGTACSATRLQLYRNPIRTCRKVYRSTMVFDSKGGPQTSLYTFEFRARKFPLVRKLSLVQRVSNQIRPGSHETYTIGRFF